MSEPIFVGGGPLAGTRKSQWAARVLAGPPLGTHRAHGRLQDGVETALGGVQVARDPLSLQFPPELVHVVCQADDILEGEGGVTVGPRLLQPGQRWEGERASGEQAPHAHMPALCGKQGSSPLAPFQIKDLQASGWRGGRPMAGTPAHAVTHFSGLMSV